MPEPLRFDDYLSILYKGTIFTCNIESAMKNPLFAQVMEYLGKNPDPPILLICSLLEDLRRLEMEKEQKK